ncbi:ABC transporter permease [Pseudonocardia nigra]|uniref:ABC transporter permease n=1 Tax=Pseudonocardia nigra TaxID=1921578 RepID=UPI001C5E2E9F|nr:ABC transporter permease subunit [Pseudonocardia nigra]
MTATVLRASRMRAGGRGRSLLAAGTVLLGLVVLVSLAAPLLAGYDPTAQQVGPRLAAPGGAHWLGTDRFGRDYASRVLHGGRQTLLLTGATMLTIIVIGTVLGAAVGIAGPRLDDLGRRVIDTVVAFPAVIVILAFVGLRGPSLTTVLGGALLVWWAPFARLSRSLVRSALAEPSAVAARALGASRGHLLRTEVRPRLVGPLGVLAAVEAGQLIATVAGLSFLGMGAQPPTAEWGAMLAEARGAALAHPHLVLGPGLAVLVTVLALTCIGEGCATSSTGRPRW